MRFTHVLIRGLGFNAFSESFIDSLRARGTDGDNVHYVNFLHYDAKTPRVVYNSLHNVCERLGANERLIIHAHSKGCQLTAKLFEMCSSNNGQLYHKVRQVHLIAPVDGPGLPISKLALLAKIPRLSAEVLRTGSTGNPRPMSAFDREIGAVFGEHDHIDQDVSARTTRFEMLTTFSPFAWLLGKGALYTGHSIKQVPPSEQAPPDVFVWYSDTDRVISEQYAKRVARRHCGDPAANARPVYGISHLNMAAHPFVAKRIMEEVNKSRSVA